MSLYVANLIIVLTIFSPSNCLVVCAPRAFLVSRVQQFKEICLKTKRGRGSNSEHGRINEVTMKIITLSILVSDMYWLISLKCNYIREKHIMSAWMGAYVCMRL